jgi:hypothetical protein
VVINILDKYTSSVFKVEIACEDTLSDTALGPVIVYMNTKKSLRIPENSEKICK